MGRKGGVLGWGSGGYPFVIVGKGLQLGGGGN